MNRARRNALAGTGLVLALVLRQSRQDPAVVIASGGSPARDLSGLMRPERDQTNPRTIQIHVDPKSEPGERALSPRDVCRIVEKSAPLPWEPRVSLEGRQVLAVSDSEEAPVFAVRVPSGFAVLVANHGDDKAAVSVSVRLDRGVYGVEQHAFGISDATERTRTERLQSVRLAGPGLLVKPTWLLPGSAAVVRIRDRGAELNAALIAARMGVQAVRSVAARPARLIASPVAEAGRHGAEIVANVGVASPSKVNIRAERALLSSSLALTLFRNSRETGSVSGPAADMLERALERMDFALQELLSDSLGLVPNAAWENGGSGSDSPRKLLVEMRNGGAAALNIVKISISPKAGCRILPNEPALFSIVRPGETVRATFTAQTDSGTRPAAVQVDFSYVTRRAPKRLRLTVL